MISPAMEIGDYLPHLARAGHVYTGGQFVQKQDGRLVYHASGESELALHALGVGLELAVRGSGEAKYIKQFARASDDAA